VGTCKRHEWEEFVKSTKEKDGTYYRRYRKCKKCGRVEFVSGSVISGGMEFELEEDGLTWGPAIPDEVSR
jgi:hypothetical protein